MERRNTNRLRHALGPSQHLEQRRDRPGLAFVVAHRTGKRHLEARRQQLREEEALLIVTVSLHRKVGQRVAHASAHWIRQQRIFGDGAGKEVAVQADQEQPIEAARAGLHGTQHLNAAALPSQLRAARLLEAAFEEERELLGVEIEREPAAARHFQRKLERVARRVPDVPAELALDPRAKPRQVAGQGRRRRCRGSPRADGTGRDDRGIQQRVRNAAAGRARRAAVLRYPQTVADRQPRVLVFPPLFRSGQRSHVADASGAERVEHEAQVRTLRRNQGALHGSLPVDRVEPALCRHPLAEPEQEQQVRQPPGRGSRGSRLARGRKGNPQAPEVLAERHPVAVQVSRDHGQALGQRPRVEQRAQALGHRAHFGVGARRVEHDDGRRRLAGSRLRHASEASDQAVGERDADVIAGRLAGIRRTIEVEPRAAVAHQRLEQIGLHAGGVGKAVNQHGSAGERRFGIRLESLARPSQPLRGVSQAALSHPLGQAGRNAHDGLRALVELPGLGLGGEHLRHALGVSGLEAGVEQVRHRGFDDAVSVDEGVEALAQRGLLPRRLPGRHGKECVVRGGNQRVGAARDLVHEAIERLDPNAEHRTAAAPQQRGREMLGEGSRGGDDADRPHQSRRLPDPLLAQRFEVGEQPRLEGPRAPCRTERRVRGDLIPHLLPAPPSGERAYQSSTRRGGV